MNRIIQSSISNLEANGNSSVFNNYLYHLENFKNELISINNNTSLIKKFSKGIKLIRTLSIFKKIRKYDNFAFNQIQIDKSLIEKIDNKEIENHYSKDLDTFISQMNYLFDKRNLTYTELLGVFHSSVFSFLKPLSENLSEYCKCLDQLSFANSRLIDDTLRIRDGQKNIFKKKLKVLYSQLNPKNFNVIAKHIKNTMYEFENMVINEKTRIKNINKRINRILSEIEECKNNYSLVISNSQTEKLDSLSHSLHLCRADSIESKFVIAQLILDEATFYSLKTDIICNNNRQSVLYKTNNYTSGLINEMQLLSRDMLSMDKLPDIPVISGFYSDTKYRRIMERFAQIKKSLIIVQPSD